MNINKKYSLNLDINAPKHIINQVENENNISILLFDDLLKDYKNKNYKKWRKNLNNIKVIIKIQW